MPVCTYEGAERIDHDAEHDAVAGHDPVAGHVNGSDNANVSEPEAP